MYSGSVAATGTHAAGCAAAVSSAQSTSRPGISGACSCGRCRMMQRRGLTSARSIALSSSGLYGTTRFISTPHEAETMTAGRAWLIRAASSCDAKPPNTTEWIAPIRAHASIAMAASGTIGM